MKTEERRVIIDAEPKEVFEFTVEPKNTPKWIDAAGEERINTEQIGLGTVYSNNYGDLKVTDYERDKFFELTNEATSYRCSYTYRKLDDGATELTYFEYMQDGSELTEPMKEKYFERLKEVLEK